MVFRPMKGLKDKLPHDEQAYIYFLCLNYDKQVPLIRDFIDSIISDVCEGDCNKERALLELLKSGYHANAESIAMKNLIQRNTLYDLRGKFFLEYAARERNLWI